MRILDYILMIILGCLIFVIVGLTINWNFDGSGDGVYAEMSSYWRSVADAIKKDNSGMLKKVDSEKVED